jgi:hypothetical protein
VRVAPCGVALVSWPLGPSLHHWAQRAQQRRWHGGAGAARCALKWLFMAASARGTLQGGARSAHVLLAALLFFGGGGVALGRGRERCCCSSASGAVCAVPCRSPGFPARRQGRLLNTWPPLGAPLRRAVAAGWRACDVHAVRLGQKKRLDWPGCSKARGVHTRPLMAGGCPLCRQAAAVARCSLVQRLRPVAWHWSVGLWARGSTTGRSTPSSAACMMGRALHAAP